eukprot:3563475-Rhodomonas_salina.1
MRRTTVCSTVRSWPSRSVTALSETAVHVSKRLASVASRRLAGMAARICWLKASRSAAASSQARSSTSR